MPNYRGQKCNKIVNRLIHITLWRLPRLVGRYDEIGFLYAAIQHMASEQNEKYERQLDRAARMLDEIRQQREVLRLQADALTKQMEATERQYRAMQEQLEAITADELSIKREKRERA